MQSADFVHGQSCCLTEVSNPVKRLTQHRHVLCCNTEAPQQGLPSTGTLNLVLPLNMMLVEADPVHALISAAGQAGPSSCI